MTFLRHNKGTAYTFVFGLVLYTLAFFSHILMDGVGIDALNTWSIVLVIGGAFIGLFCAFGAGLFLLGEYVFEYRKGNPKYLSSPR